MRERFLESTASYESFSTFRGTRATVTRNRIFSRTDASHTIIILSLHRHVQKTFRLGRSRRYFIIRIRRWESDSFAIQKTIVLSAAAADCRRTSSPRRDFVLLVLSGRKKTTWNLECSNGFGRRPYTARADVALRARLGLQRERTGFRTGPRNHILFFSVTLCARRSVCALLLSCAGKALGMINDCCWAYTTQHRVLPVRLTLYAPPHASRV